MARERWFYVKDMRRMGPVLKRQLVESLLTLPDPRGSLIWRHGLTAWTAAREVPEIDRQLVPFAKAETAPAPPPATVPAPAAVPTEARTRTARQPHAPSIGLYFGGLAVVLVVVTAGWFLWPRSSGGGGSKSAGRDAGGAKQGEAPAASPRAGEPPSTTARDPGAPGFAGWSDQEVELPTAELRRLRGVGAWSGNTLTITLYNGSNWRITEILVRTSHLRGEEFIDQDTPQRLLPAGGAQVAAGTAELLNKVAPDRRKPGVNPLDTGSFEATVGPQPAAYRWKIEGARGYPPIT